MSQLDLVVRAERAIIAGGQRSVAVGVLDGTVVAVESFAADLRADQVVELGADEVLMPGVVDSHVHVNDPGRTEWEGFASATRAAAAGGVTTIVDMPLNSIPPTVDLAALEVKRKTASGQSYVDVGFWGGAVPGNVAELAPLHDAGVFGFKCFLLHSGVDEFAPLDAAGLGAAMREIARFDGLLIVHAEDAHAIAHAPEPHGGQYADFLASRPRDAENRAVQQLIDLSRATGCRVHVLHVSSAEALPVLAEARRGGVRVTAETCPHYLSFAAEEIADGATLYKCCPPIRERDNRDRLWDGLRDGVLDLVVSDHSPSTIELKRLEEGDFGTAWGGISSLQVSLPAVWTEARRRGHDLVDVARWMCEGPAAQTGMRGKGRIALGCDADFAVLAPEETFVVDARNLHHKNAVTPYAGRELAGVVRSTWLRGARIDLDADPRGRLLRRGDA
ncbi:allantoinase AllB [Nocardioides immobilis]|uniref:allantoinase n=1 Tax=Nocardioides immobilis TaxID=2049295 RepID=A0A417Y0D3_9ACTN|nr:allantoinase AllB [Nocardioides immobilis]RHW26056.1 allantoinase AllB [Nocardioides immobilis]